MLSRLFKTITAFIRELYSKRDLIFSLAARDFRSGYFGSLLGIIWVFVEPVIYMFVMWFFFTKAVKFRPSSDHPYVAWLMSSMVLWMFFSSAFVSSVGTFKSYAYLLRRPRFNMSIMPVVSIGSSLIVHGIFILLLIALLLASRVSLTIYWLQSVYYLFSTCILLLGLSWITASLSLFIHDIRNAVGVILQIGFWVSPIFWDLNTYPEKYRFLLRLNPLTYLLEGYRKSFLYAEPFWSDVKGSLYFWSFSIIVLSIGMITYKKLRPHFGDVI
jgi:ABC-type polysaccharide/polyol phosphate export permease